MLCLSFFFLFFGPLVFLNFSLQIRIQKTDDPAPLSRSLSVSVSLSLSLFHTLSLFSQNNLSVHHNKHSMHQFNLQRMSIRWNFFSPSTLSMCYKDAYVRSVRYKKKNIFYIDTPSMNFLFLSVVLKEYHGFEINSMDTEYI